MTSDTSVILVLLELSPVILFIVVWTIIVAVLRTRSKTSILYLSLLTIFYFYLFIVFYLTLFHYQALSIMKVFFPELLLRGQEPGLELNLVPFVTLKSDDLKTSILNIIMMIPFGLFLPLLKRSKFLQVTIFGILTSISIEVLQYITGKLAGTFFRVTDVNDIIFNTVGVIIGYAIFATIMHFLRRLDEMSWLGRSPIVIYLKNQRNKN